MQVNKNLSQEIYQDAGEARTIKAKRYINQGKVNIIRTNYEDQNNFSINCIRALRRIPSKYRSPKRRARDSFLWMLRLWNKLQCM